LQIFSNLNDIGSHFRDGSVVTLGNFDGIHIAHQSLLQKLQESSLEYNLPPVVVTYYPNPTIVLGKNKDLKYIYLEEKKFAIMEKLGIQNVLVIPFTLELSEISAYEYIKQILHGVLHAKHIILGYNHFFGKNREGDFDFLSKYSSEFNYTVSKLDPVFMGDIKISSSYLRSLLQEGNVEKAKDILGSPFSIKGEVIHGEKRGRTIGFPTANLKVDENQLIPGNGVYAGFISHNNINYKAMTNIGTKPTFNELNRTIEVYILNFSDDLYGKKIEFMFIKKIRDEKKFNGISELKTQLEIDRTTTEGIEI
jgi:riboflavin kinase / FMN adenylyltransferase